MRKVKVRFANPVKTAFGGPFSGEKITKKQKDNNDGR